MERGRKGELKNAMPMKKEMKGETAKHWTVMSFLLNAYFETNYSYWQEKRWEKTWSKTLLDSRYPKHLSMMRLYVIGLLILGLSIAV